MKQFNIKSNEAAQLLDELTKCTGKGKTEIILEALSSYRQELDEDQELRQLVKFVEEELHTMVKPEALGHAPSKEDIETMLGMP